MLRLSQVSQSSKYGKGEVHIRDEDEEATDRADASVERLRQTFESPQYVPPLLPQAAIEAHRLMQKQSVKFDDIIKVLEQDPLLAARILRVASSPAFGAGSAKTLHAALVRLGIKNITTIVWQVAMNSRVFRSKVYAAPMERVRLHSLATAHMAKLVAGTLGVQQDQAFLAGLLHDVGAAGAILVLGEWGSNDGPLTEKTLADVLMRIHASASGFIAERWGFQSDIRQVLEYHHATELEGRANLGASLVQLSEFLVSEHEGFSLSFGEGHVVDPVSPEIVKKSRERLQVSDGRLDHLRERAADLIAWLREAPLD